MRVDQRIWLASLNRRLAHTKAKAEPAKATVTGSDPGSKTKASEKATRSRGKARASLRSDVGPKAKALKRPEQVSGNRSKDTLDNQRNALSVFIG